MGAPQRQAPLSFGERLAQLVERVEYRRADTAEDREAIYRLRYAAYLREGAITASFGQRLSDRYDDLDNAWLVGLHIDGRLASSMRIHVANRDYPDFVASDVFGEFIKPEIEAGKVIVDPTRFVADAQMARLYPELPYLTVRVGHMAAEYFGADLVLATVRAEHQAFYKRVFGHKVVCPPRPYPLLVKPLSLMMLDYRATRTEIMRRYPFFGSTLEEQREMFGLWPVVATPRESVGAPLAV